MKLLVCVDGSAQSLRAVEKAVEIASGCQIDEVALIGVYESLISPDVSQGDDGETILFEVEKYKALNGQLQKNFKQQLDLASTSFKSKGIEPEIFVEEGHPAHNIIQSAEKGHFDMIIMGSRGKGNLEKMLLGSVSNAVIQETSVSVLIVK